LEYITKFPCHGWSLDNLCGASRLSSSLPLRSLVFHTLLQLVDLRPSSEAAAPGFGGMLKSWSKFLRWLPGGFILRNPVFISGNGWRELSTTMRDAKHSFEASV
jgi:hypothetical protein